MAIVVLYHTGASFLKCWTEMKVGELPMRGTFLICKQHRKRVGA
jgi:hypothetical protein